MSRFRRPKATECAGERGVQTHSCMDPKRLATKRLTRWTGNRAQVKKQNGQRFQIETPQDLQSRKRNLQTYKSWSSTKPRDVEENLNSEHLVKNNLHVSLHLCSAQSFKKIKLFTAGCHSRPTVASALRFSHSGPSDCLTSLERNRTTP